MLTARVNMRIIVERLALLCCQLPSKQAVHAEVADGLVVRQGQQGMAVDGDAVQPPRSCRHRLAICVSPDQLALGVIEAQLVECHEVVHPLVLHAHVGQRVGESSGIVCVAERRHGDRRGHPAAQRQAMLLRQ